MSKSILAVEPLTVRFGSALAIALALALTIGVNAAVAEGADTPVAGVAPPKLMTGQSTVAAAGPADHHKGLAGRAVDKVEQLGRSIADVFRRVPCAGPKSGTYLEGSLPHIGKKLAANDPVTIVAFGSSSTVGFGVSSPAFT